MTTFVHFVHWCLSNLAVLGLLGTLLILVPIFGIMIIHDPD